MAREMLAYAVKQTNASLSSLAHVLPYDREGRGRKKNDASAANHADYSSLMANCSALELASFGATFQQGAYYGVHSARGGNKLTLYLL